MPALQSSRSAPAMPRDETLRIVRDNVRAMLLSSPAFRAQTPEAQRQIAHDTVTVARFIADAGGATAGVPLTAVITNPAAARTARAAPARPFAPPAAPTSAGRRPDRLRPGVGRLRRRRPPASSRARQRRWSTRSISPASAPT